MVKGLVDLFLSYHFERQVLMRCDRIAIDVFLDQMNFPNATWWVFLFDSSSNEGIT